VGGPSALPGAAVVEPASGGTAWCGTDAGGPAAGAGPCLQIPPQGRDTWLGSIPFLLAPQIQANRRGPEKPGTAPSHPLVKKMPGSH
jgi:hypothetical protein